MITEGFSLTSWINIELEASILALCLNMRAMQVSTTPTFGWVDPGIWDLLLESLFYICGWKNINSNGLIIYADMEEQTKMIFSHIQCFCQQFLWIIKLPVSRNKRYTLMDKMSRMVHGKHMTGHVYKQQELGVTNSKQEFEWKSRQISKQMIKIKFAVKL